MLLQTTQLSPARCHQLREGGILQLMVNLLHEHTFEPHDQPEENTNIESFLFNYNGKSKFRQRLSRQIRTIIENTSEDSAELEVFDLLEALRNYTETLYGFLTDIPKSKPEVIPPLYEIGKLFTMTISKDKKHLYSELKEERNDPITMAGYIEQFGGVYVILDLLRAHRRFVVRFQEQVIYKEINQLPLEIPEQMKAEYKARNGFSPAKHRNSSGPVTEPMDVRYEHQRLISKLLHNLTSFNRYIKVEVKTFLANSRSFNQLLIDTLEGAKEMDYFMFLRFVNTNSIIIYQLNHSFRRRNSYAIDCGVIKCLTKLAIEIEHSYAGISARALFKALSSLLYSNRENVTEFFWIDGSVDMLIDVLKLPEEKQQEAQKWAIEILRHINFFFLKKSPNSPAERQLLALYESRDIAAILLDNIRRIPSDASVFTTWNLLQQLKNILFCSEVLPQKFAQIEGAKEEIAKFHDSTDWLTSRAAKWISENI